jgi:hypothetical protein
VQGLGICLKGDRDLAGEICVGILHATHTRLAFSTEDTDEIWKVVKEEVMEKVKGRANSLSRTDSPMVEEVEVEKSFWLSRPDGWVINRKTKKIILLEFKRTSDSGESYFKDMWRVTEKQHTPIMIGLRALAEEREWEVSIVPLVGGQWSTREKEWLETLRIFGIGKEDGQRIIGRLDRTLLDEHEKPFRSYWRHTFGPSNNLLQLLGKGISPDLTVSPGRLDRRSLETVGSPLWSRTSRPLHIYCKICANLFNIYLVFSPSFIRICFPPRLRVEPP